MLTSSSCWLLPTIQSFGVIGDDLIAAVLATQTLLFVKWLQGEKRLLFLLQPKHAGQSRVVEQLQTQQYSVLHSEIKYY